MTTGEKLTGGRWTARRRLGAVIGASVGPPILILWAYPLIRQQFGTGPPAAGKGVLWVLSTYGAWAIGVIVMPILGACIGGRRWLTREEARRLATYCIGGAIVGAVAAAGCMALGRFSGTREDALDVFRMLLGESGLVAGAILGTRAWGGVGHAGEAPGGPGGDGPSGDRSER